MKYISLESLPEIPTAHGVGKKKIMISKDEIPTLLQFAQATFAPLEIAQAHSHSNAYEIFLIEQGIGLMLINGKEYQLQPGVCIMVEPKEMHEVRNTGKIPLTLTYFNLLT
jgi:mannose-6-phosphate isomerase-like protein (cupin superfamily)